MQLDTNNHSVFMLHYHLIMCEKYRNKVIDDTISNRLKEIFVKIAPACNIALEEWNHDIDHVHILFRLGGNQILKSVSLSMLTNLQAVVS